MAGDGVLREQAGRRRWLGDCSDEHSGCEYGRGLFDWGFRGWRLVTLARETRGWRVLALMLAERGCVLEDGGNYR